MAVTRAFEPHLDAELFELLERLLAQRLGHGLQHARAALDQQHLRAAGVDVAELARQRVLGDLGQRAGHFHARGTGADHHEGEQGRGGVPGRR